jgi:chitinase
MARSAHVLVFIALLGAGACGESHSPASDATLSFDDDRSAALTLNAPYQIQSALKSNRCLSTGASPTNGTRVTLADCGNDAPQIWVRPGTNAAIVGNGKFCLDVTGGVAKNGTPVQLWACDSTNNNQRWTYTGGTIQWMGHDLCLNVVDGQADEGAALQLWACNKEDAHSRWRFMPGSQTATPSPTTQPQTSPQASASGASVSRSFIFSPYKDVGINTNWNTFEISTLVTGQAQTVLAALPQVDTVTWSFATGECGNESWAGITPAQLAGANVARWAAAKKGYILSTGGAAGAFTCGSDAGFNAFLDRYASSSLRGVDFDIEAGQSQATIEALVARVKAAQAGGKYSGLRYSFTLATLGGKDENSLGAAGVTVMKAIKAAGLTQYTINLMTMDYGSDSASTCTLNSSGRCDMGLSAVQAAINLHTAYGVPYSQIEITPMIGGNDTVGEVFSMADLTTVANFAKAQGLAGVHTWSVDRDRDCNDTYASSVCNSYGKAGTLGFINGFLKAF